MNLRIPAPAIVRAWFARGIRLWLIVRLTVAVVPVLVAAADPADVLRYSLSGSVVLLSCCALLGFLDTRMRKERALLANLGISDREIVLLFAAPAALGEMMLAIALPW